MLYFNELIRPEILKKLIKCLGLRREDRSMLIRYQSLINENNVKCLILIILCFIILGILFCIVTSKFREGLDNTVGLTDFTHSDPNIKPTPLPDICIGNGNFISQPNSTIPVTATAGYLHSNIGACENECTPERGCFAVSFDRASKDVMKKCNIYSGATSVGENTTKAGLLCSRISPTCSVDSYKLNNTSSDLATVIKPNGGEYFTHSTEGYCAVECNNRANCIGYLYDNKSKNYLKPCRIFSKNKNGLSTGFPVAGICSRDMPTSTPGTPSPSGTPPPPSGKCVPNVPALAAVGNPVLDGIAGNGCKNFTTQASCGPIGALCPQCCIWEPDAPPPSPQAPPPSGAPPPPPPPTGKCSVFVPGLVATYGAGFPPFVPIATANCAKETTAEGCIYMAQGGGGAKAPLCAWTPTPVPPPVAPPAQVSGLAGNWNQIGEPTTMTIILQDAGVINGKPKIIGAGSGVVGGTGWGFLNTPNSMFFKFGNGITLPAALQDKNSSGQFTKIIFNNGTTWTRITSTGTPPPTTPGTPPPTTPETPPSTTSVIPPDHPRAKIINRVLNPIIGRGTYQSPLPIAQ